MPELTALRVQALPRAPSDSAVIKRSRSLLVPWTLYVDVQRNLSSPLRRQTEGNLHAMPKSVELRSCARRIAPPISASSTCVSWRKLSLLEKRFQVVLKVALTVGSRRPRINDPVLSFERELQPSLQRVSRCDDRCVGWVPVRMVLSEKWPSTAPSA